MAHATAFRQNLHAHSPEGHEGVEVSPEGYFIKTGWIDETISVIIIGNKSETPDRPVKQFRALASATAILHGAKTFGRHSGLAAYDAWKNHILNNTHFETENA